MINWEKWRWMFFPDGGTCRHLWHVEIIANWLSFSYAILWQHFNRQLDERYWNFKVFNKKKYNLNEYKLKKCSSPYLLQISINTYQQYTTTCTSSELSFNHSKLHLNWQCVSIEWSIMTSLQPCWCRGGYVYLKMYPYSIMTPTLFPIYSLFSETGTFGFLHLSLSQFGAFCNEQFGVKIFFQY